MHPISISIFHSFICPSIKSCSLTCYVPDFIIYIECESCSSSIHVPSIPVEGASWPLERRKLLISLHAMLTHCPGGNKIFQGNENKGEWWVVWEEMAEKTQTHKGQVSGPTSLGEWLCQVQNQATWRLSPCSLPWCLAVFPFFVVVLFKK